MNSAVCIASTAAQYSAFPYVAGDPLAAALRSLFLAWGKDPDNPFQEWVGPGARVVIKPNWVLHESLSNKGIECLVTHTSLIKHVIDAVAVALQGQGSITIGDAPLQSCDFQTLLERTRVVNVVDQVRRKYPGIDITIEDWRLTIFENMSAAQKRNDTYAAIGETYEIIDLGKDSFLEEISDYADRFRVTCYAPHLMAAHHRKGKHEYLVTRRVLDADLVINLPKMKTHIKAGLTGALKNLVGINGHKEFLPHHILGGSDRGGDCYYKANKLRDVYDAAYDKFWTHYGHLPETGRKAGTLLLSALWRASRIITGDSTSAGSWHGNETIWRMTLDLNHLLYFGNRAPKQVISIVDGVIAGEGEGPLSPLPKPAGLLVAGENPAYVDAALAALMGYNISRVPTVYHAIYHRRSQFGGASADAVDIRFCQGRAVKAMSIGELPNLNFLKPEHWQRAARFEAPADSADSNATTQPEQP